MKAKLAKLIDVKSIMTIVLTITFCLCVGLKNDVNSDFFTLYTMVVSFYFGSQFSKKKEDNINGY